MQEPAVRASAADDQDAPVATSSRTLPERDEQPVMNQPEERRLNVKFTPEAYAQLQEMARRRGKTISETVREALGFDLWLEEQMLAGNKLLLERPDGRIATVAVPRR